MLSSTHALSSLSTSLGSLTAILTHTLHLQPAQHASSPALSPAQRTQVTTPDGKLAAAADHCLLGRRGLERGAGGCLLSSPTLLFNVPPPGPFSRTSREEGMCAHVCVCEHKGVYVCMPVCLGLCVCDVKCQRTGQEEKREYQRESHSVPPSRSRRGGQAHFQPEGELDLPLRPPRRIVGSWRAAEAPGGERGYFVRSPPRPGEKGEAEEGGDL